MREANIIAISVSTRKGVKKHNVPEAQLIAGLGIEGDAHAGFQHRQVSLLGIESIELMRSRGADVQPGDFAENITVEGITLFELPVGTKLSIGEAVLSVSQIGKECHAHCAIYHEVGSCIMPTQGIFAVVEKGGPIRVGDKLVVHA